MANMVFNENPTKNWKLREFKFLDLNKKWTSYVKNDQRNKVNTLGENGQLDRPFIPLYSVTFTIYAIGQRSQRSLYSIHVLVPQFSTKCNSLEYL